MDVVLLNIVLAWILTGSPGVASDVTGTQDNKPICGVVVCSEASGRAASGDPCTGNADASSLSISNITSLTIYKTVHSGQQSADNSQRRSPLARLTTEQASLIHVSDSVTISGRLSAARATLRLELSRQEDCRAEFVCELRGLDAEQGRDLVAVTHLQPQGWPGAAEDISAADGSVGKILTLMQQFSSTLTSLTHSVEKLERRVGSVEGKFLNGFTDKFSSLEAKMSRVEMGIKSCTGRGTGASDANCSSSARDSEEDAILTGLDQELAPLRHQVSSVSRALVVFKDAFEKVMSGSIASLQQDARTGWELVIQNLTNVCSGGFSSHDGGVLPDDKVPADADAGVGGGDDEDDNKDEGNDKVKDGVSLLSTTLEPAHGSASATPACDAVRQAVSRVLRPGACSKGMRLSDTGYTLRFPYAVVCPETESRYVGPYLCDANTDGGGWIIIQRRFNGDMDFYRSWAEYKAGFGSLSTDFWLGNEQIHAITSSGQYELRVELGYLGEFKYARYAEFRVADESRGYALYLGSYMRGGRAMDSLLYHNGSMFSTWDRDNDRTKDTDCAKVYQSGWWYNACKASDLNGPWPGIRGGKNAFLNWRTFSDFNPLTSSEMKIRRVGG